MIRRALSIGALALAASASPGFADDGLAAIAAAVPACAAARAHCFGLHLHVVAADAGFVVTPAWIATQVANANALFAPIDVGFQLAGVDTLPAGAAHVETRAQRNAFADGGLPDKVVHVFLIGKLENVDDPQVPVYGVTWHVPDSDHKYIILAANAFERTLAHELGHVFGLPHSAYAISIMNKAKRTVPPREERRFADEEIAPLRKGLARLLADKILADITP